MLAALIMFSEVSLMLSAGTAEAASVKADSTGTVSSSRAVDQDFQEETETSSVRQEETAQAAEQLIEDTGMAVPAKVKALIRKYEDEQDKEVHFTSTILFLVQNRTVKLTFNKNPGKVSYKISGKKVARVSSDGTVTTRRKGVAVVTAKTGKGTRHIVIYVMAHTGSTSEKISRRIRSAKSSVTKKSRKKTIVLAGSSSFDRWSTAAEAFPGCNVINTAIGGTTALQWTVLYKQLIVPYQPDAVVLFVGSNDIGKNGLISGKECASRIQKLIENIRESLGKDVPIFYVSMLNPYSRKKAWPQEKTSNRLVKAYCGRTKNVYFIDLVPYFLGRNGKPDRKLFCKDRMHPNKKGYKIFKAVIGRKVMKVLG